MYTHFKVSRKRTFVFQLILRPSPYSTINFCRPLAKLRYSTNSTSRWTEIAFDTNRNQPRGICSRDIRAPHKHFAHNAQCFSFSFFISQRCFCCCLSRCVFCASLQVLILENIFRFLLASTVRASSVAIERLYAFLTRCNEHTRHTE